MTIYKIEVSKSGSTVESEYGTWGTAPGRTLHHLVTDKDAYETKCGIPIGPTWTLFPRLTWWAPTKIPKGQTCMNCRPLC